MWTSCQLWYKQKNRCHLLCSSSSTSSWNQACKPSHWEGIVSGSFLASFLHVALIKLTAGLLFHSILLNNLNILCYNIGSDVKSGQITCHLVISFCVQLVGSAHISAPSVWILLEQAVWMGSWLIAAGIWLIFKLLTNQRILYSQANQMRCFRCLRDIQLTYIIDLKRRSVYRLTNSILIYVPCCTSINICAVHGTQCWTIYFVPCYSTLSILQNVICPANKISFFLFNIIPVWSDMCHSHT